MFWFSRNLHQEIHTKYLKHVYSSCFPLPVIERRVLKVFDEVPDNDSLGIETCSSPEGHFLNFV